MQIETIQEGLEKIGRQIADGVYEDYYEAKTDYENIEEQKKTMLAISEMKYVEEKTQAQVSRNALVDKDYQDFIKGLNEARRKMNNCFAKVKSCEARMEIYRSLNKYSSEVAKF